VVNARAENSKSERAKERECESARESAREQERGRAEEREERVRVCMGGRGEDLQRLLLEVIGLQLVERLHIVDALLDERLRERGEACGRGRAGLSLGWPRATKPP
jgi:hypothetical protein